MQLGLYLFGVMKQSSKMNIAGNLYLNPVLNYTWVTYHMEDIINITSVINEEL